ncbi:MAG: DUF4333 domain-containing protein [Solirubrobacterales bacterium]
MALIGGAVGCGDDTLDADATAEKIKMDLEQERLVKVKSVDCPDGIEKDDGARFECKLVQENGTKQRVLVEQVDTKGTFTFSVAPPKSGR